MSNKELSRLEIMQRLAKRQMSQKEAEEILHFSGQSVQHWLHTQFGRAMQKLDIQIIWQAKGRVERANQTLQDRLPIEMRLLNIRSREDGNAYLPEFMADFHKRFADEPQSLVDLHRPLTAKDDLACILTWQEARTISNRTPHLHDAQCGCDCLYTCPPKYYLALQR